MDPAAGLSDPPLTKPASCLELRLASAMFSRTERSSTSPCSLRDSGTIARPARMARDGEPGGTASPSTSTAPPSRGSAPKIARSVSDLPLPTSPATPTISPALISIDTPRTAVPRRRSRTLSSTGAASFTGAGSG